jgi:soluble lytic murein transglycosylase-like protein
MSLVLRLRVGTAVLLASAALAAPALADGLEPLSANDARAYAMAFEASDRGDFIDAQMKAVEIKDKSLVGYISFRQLMHPSAHKASFDELTGWLSKFRDLPLAERVFSLAAKRKPADAEAPPEPELSLADLHKVDLPSVDVGRMAREAFYSGDARKALELAPAAGERWIAGLAAYRLANYLQAQTFFAEIAYDAAEDPWLRSGAAFWAARTATALGEDAKSRTFLRLAAQHPTTFYGIIADRQVRLLSAAADTGQVILAAYNAPAPQPQRTAPAKLAKADPELVKFAEKQVRAHRAAALIQLGRIEEARVELRAGLALARTDKDRASWTKLISALGAATPSYGSTGAAPAKRMAAGPSEYPSPDLTPVGGFTIDKALVYAIGYQESRFNPAAVSPVGAIGLMQLMPESAARAVGDDKLKSDPSPLFDAAYNMRAGQDYIAWLMDRGVGYDILRVVAAYNGGPGAVLNTLKKVGADADPLLIIECLPAQETRNYVEKVMAAYWTYRRQWGQDTPTLDAVVNGVRMVDARMDLIQTANPATELSAQTLEVGLPKSRISAD